MKARRYGFDIFLASNVKAKFASESPPSAPHDRR